MGADVHPNVHGFARLEHMSGSTLSRRRKLTSMISASRDPHWPSAAVLMSAVADSVAVARVGVRLRSSCAATSSDYASTTRFGSPCWRRRPSSSQSASSQKRSTRSSWWVTSRTVFPRRELSELVEALVRERLVADREHLVDQQHLGVDVDRDREPEPHVHARTSRS